ncbi:TPA: conjugal transfer protein TraF [Vibrio parahaemolyticus]
MKTQFKILATTITASLFANVASAATYAIEARSDAMGGVGTVSASYLTAPFFNPALTAIYRRNDDAGMIIPSFGISYDDQYDLIDEIERISKLTDVDDNTQMIRAGFEIDILLQMALRGGYMKNLARSNDEGTITAGIGLSPLNLIELDIAARYTNENAMGASINFLATY